MRPAARLQTIAELLPLALSERQPADRLVQQWGRQNRYAGSKDRRDISDRLFAILRHYGNLTARLGGDTPLLVTMLATHLLTDVPLDEVVALAKTHYGPLRPAGKPRDTLKTADDLRVDGHEKIEVLADARVRQPSWRRFYRLPAYGPQTERQLAALDVLAEILGSGTGRLYQRLVVEERLAVAAGAYADSARLLNGEFLIYASPTPGVALADLRMPVEEEIERLQDTLVSDAELARAKVQLVSGLVFARDSQQSMAQIFGRAAALGHAPSDVLQWPSEIEAVTRADVRAAAQAFLQPPHSLTGHLLGTQ